MRKSFPYVLSALMAVSLSQIAFAQSRGGDASTDPQEPQKAQRRQDSGDRQANRHDGVKDRHADRGGPRTRYGGSNGGGGPGSGGR